MWYKKPKKPTKGDIGIIGNIVESCSDAPCCTWAKYFAVQPLILQCPRVFSQVVLSTKAHEANKIWHLDWNRSPMISYERLLTRDSSPPSPGHNSPRFKTSPHPEVCHQSSGGCPMPQTLLHCVCPEEHWGEILANSRVKHVRPWFVKV